MMKFTIVETDWRESISFRRRSVSAFILSVVVIEWREAESLIRPIAWNALMLEWITLRLPATTLQIVTALLFFAAICPNWDS
jgi:hypothetical protein